MICPLWTDTWTLMQHRKSLDFVHTLKETEHFEQLLFTILLQGRFPPHIQRSQGVDHMPAHWICYSRSWSHSQLFLFSSQLSQYPAASHSLLSFSLSSRHLRFLQLPSLQEGHLCFSSSSGQRDKVLERAEIKGDTSASFCSASSSSNSSLSVSLIEEQFREESIGESLDALLIFSGEGSVFAFLCDFPLWIFKPFSDL